MAGQKVAVLLGARNSKVGTMAGSSSDLQPLSPSAVSRKSLLSPTARARLGRPGAADAGAAAWARGVARTPGRTLDIEVRVGMKSHRSF